MVGRGSYSSPKSRMTSSIDFSMSSIRFPISSIRPTTFPLMSQNRSCICLSRFCTKVLSSLAEVSSLLDIRIITDIASISFNIKMDCSFSNSLTHSQATRASQHSNYLQIPSRSKVNDQNVGMIRHTKMRANSMTGKIVKNQPKQLTVCEPLQMSRPNQSSIDNYSRTESKKGNEGMGLRSAVLAAQRETKYILLMNEYQQKKEQLNRELKMIKNGCRTKQNYGGLPFHPLASPATLSLSKVEVTHKAPIITEKVSTRHCSQQSKIDQFSASKLQSPSFQSSNLQSSKLQSSKLQSSKFQSFISAMKQQIILEEKLRLFKHSLNSETKATMIPILKSLYQMKPDTLEIMDEEFDPYVKAGPIEKNINALAEQLHRLQLEANQHWEKQLKNSFEVAELRQIFTRFDGNPKKGLVTLQAFVRQMGILMANERHLRNRDLARIHGRVSPFTEDNFVRMLGR